MLRQTRVKKGEEEGFGGEVRDKRVKSNKKRGLLSFEGRIDDDGKKNE